MGRVKTTLITTLLWAVCSSTSTMAALDLDLRVSVGKDNHLPDEVPMVDIQPATVINPELGPFPNLDPCTPSKCKLPDCWCSGNAVPGGLKVKDVPQMVVLTFQNAINGANYGFYTQLINKRKNPNGCPATSTFFVSHNYTDYFQVQSLYAARQEIADNTVTFPPPGPPKLSDWQKQLLSQKKILSQFGGIKSTDIRGERAPYLAPGGDAEIQALTNSQLLYDSSRTTVKFTESPTILWPYTYDYASTQDCVTPPCPSSSFPGKWEVPVVAWKCSGVTVASPTGCPVTTEQQAYNLLWNKFVQHHNSTNRAPLVIVIDTAWVISPFKLSATLKFLAALPDDTYLVSAWQALQWIRSPTVLNKIKSFKPWQCSGAAPKVCQEAQANNCLYDAQRRLVTGGQTPVYRMRTCAKCPRCYPGLDDPLGQTC